MKERYCPWCDRKYQAESNKSNPLCDECRTDLLEQQKEFLVDMLGHVAGVNVLAMAALRGSPHLLEEFGLVGSGSEEADSGRRKLTLKELARTRQRVTDVGLTRGQCGRQASPRFVGSDTSGIEL